MSYSISDNDDDLFDYDPSQETSTQVIDQQYTETPVSDISSDDQTKHQREFINSLKTNINDADADLDLHDDTKMNVLVSNLYGSFQEAINTFVGMISKDTFSRSVHITLDELTNGRFSMLNMFHYYESRIISRIALINLFGTVFHNDSLDADEEAIAPFLQKVSDLLKINFTKNYYNSTFNVTIDILNHSLTIDKVIYQFLGDKLHLPLNELTTLDFNELNSADLERIMHNLTSDGFRQTMHEAMLESFMSVESTENNVTLKQRVKDVFNTEVQYMNSMKYIE